MTKQEIIQKVDSLNAQIEALYTKETLLAQAQNNLIANFLTPYLEQYQIIGNGFELDVHREYFYIKRKRENESYSREMITIYAKQSYGNDSKILNLDTSFYSTSENSIFELERMVVIGRVAQLLLDKSEELISNLEFYYANYSKDSRALYKQRWGVEAQVKDLEKQLESINDSEVLDKLNKGVYFENPVQLTFRFNDTSWIKYLKVKERKRASVTIEYISNYSDIVREDKIRFNNIEAFIQHRKKAILNSTLELVS